jgi:hypothetical protein
MQYKSPNRPWLAPGSRIEWLTKIVAERELRAAHFERKHMAKVIGSYLNIQFFFFLLDLLLKLPMNLEALLGLAIAASERPRVSGGTLRVLGRCHRPLGNVINAITLGSD